MNIGKTARQSLGEDQMGRKLNIINFSLLAYFRIFSFNSL